MSKFAAQLESLDMGDERNRLLYMFTRVVYMPEQEFETLTPIQQRFYEECQITNFTDMEKQGYVKSLMEHADVREMVECEREDAREEGFNEGFERGIEKGVEQGLLQGREEGREQGRTDEKRQLTLIMLAEGFDPVIVSKITGMAEEEVKALLVNS